MTAALLVRTETARAVVQAVRLGMDSLRAEVPQRLADWARDNFLLAGESSHQKGGWTAWAFQVGIMDFMSDDRIEDLSVMKSKRVGYTKMITAFVAYNIAHRRRKQALWQPTDDDRDSYVKSEIGPVLDPDTGIPAVNKARRRGRAVEDTIKFKQFRDSVLHLLGGKAARAYRRITVAVAILDEWSAFDQQIEKSGDPGGLARGRLEGAAFPKFVGGSTPRIKGLCHVERGCNEADGFVRFHIDCPRCGADHPLMWGGRDMPYGMKWEKGKPETVRHVCPHCRGSITQADYLPAGEPLQGAWVCSRTGKRYGPDRVWRDRMGMPCNPPRTLGVHVWAAYSPQRSWPSIVDEFEKALVKLEAGEVGPMQLFVNETLAETWEHQGDRSDEHALQARADEYSLGTVPVGALVLTAGVDVQGNRWEIDVWGWGRGLESWLIDSHVIEGNPADDRDWDQLAIYLQRRYTQAWHGGSLGIDAVSIDSGHHTQAVYNFVRVQQHRMRIHAIKGSSEEGKPIKGTSSSVEVTWKGQRWPHGVKLWMVGTDTAKDLLHGQLQIAQPGPGFVHTPKGLPREWYEQLTAEQRIPVKSSSGTSERWVKRRPRNEKLDCRNYALHSAYMLGLHTFKDARWLQIEQAVQPPHDLFSPPAASAPTQDRQHDAPAAVPPAAVVAAVQSRTHNPAPRAVPRGW